MIYLKTFKLSNNRSINSNIYPFNVLKDKEPDVFLFDNITVLYGNNGSGKSTILNIIAHKLNLKGKERHEAPVPTEYSSFIDFETYSKLCEYVLGEDEFGHKIRKIPENSRYLKSEEILYEIRKIQQDAVLQESIESNLVRERGLQEAKEFLKTDEGEKQFARFQFAQDKYSNGETTMQILEDNILPDALYLLDEPEVSLSPQNQVKLAEEINKMSRYLGVQFIIATHSPFMLGILNAKIYNLDTKDYKVQKWIELENVRYFYNFFKSRENEFEK
ncbi:MAG: AAA family ATPase [Clostridia bacterium]|nr:AAA family ATPase [Clostridia bacterium]